MYKRAFGDRFSFVWLIWVLNIAAFLLNGWKKLLLWFKL